MLKKSLITLAVFLVASAALFANGGADKSAGESTEGGPVTIKMFTDAIQAQDPNMLRLAADYEAETGNKLEYVVVPGQAGEIYQKVDISLMSGDTTDLIDANSNYAQKLQHNRMALDVTDLINKSEYDLVGNNGQFLIPSDDGGIYAIPTVATYWAVFFNKSIFDNAGVPYPQGDWTWEEYIETAEKLTDESNGIFGSYMPVYDNIFYFKANMAGVDGYKADGTSNYDAPVFKEAMAFYKSLSSDYKIQPSWLEQSVKKWGSTYFLSGKCGMVFIPSWYFGPITNQDDYPRDWEIGVTSTPRFSDIENNNNFGSSAYVSINKNTQHPKEAYECAVFMARNRALYKGEFPPTSNVSKDAMSDMFAIVEAGTNGEISVSDLYNAYIDNGLGFYHEKIGGIIANEYSGIIKQEGELYIAGDSTLDETIQAITTRANEAIKQAQ
jgi:multiple sugar transport system substrate-binding protein